MMKKTIGIIAEYNPLHYGHLHQLNLAKMYFGASYIVVVMSGNFTQRGIPAVIHKKERAELAIKGGADLVIELPAYFASSTLDDFALGAISTLDKLNVVDELLFGSECNNVEMIASVAKEMAQNPETYALIRGCMREGIVSKRVEESILRKLVSSKDQLVDIKHAILQPNNMLGILYVVALSRLKSKIKPITNQRLGQGYNDSSSEYQNQPKTYASASSIREYLIKRNSTSVCQNDKDRKWYDSSCPNFTRLAIEQSIKRYRLVTQSDVFAMFKSKLSNAASMNVLRNIMNITEEDILRINNALTPNVNYYSFIQKASIGMRSSARIDRCITNCVLNHQASVFESFKSDQITYNPSILAFSKAGEELFQYINNKSSTSNSLSKIQHKSNEYADQVYMKLLTANLAKV